MKTFFYPHPSGEQTAYSFHPGDGPVIFCLGGHTSDRSKDFCQRLWRACEQRQQSLLIFDWWGYGESSPGIGEGRIREWMTQAAELFAACVTGKAILLGYSMGTPLAVLLAQLYPKQVVALIGRSSGFGLGLVDLIQTHYKELVITTRQNDKGIGFHVVDQQHLSFDRIKFNQPVRLLHALEDASVHWKTAFELSQAITSPDIQLLFDKQGNHSRPTINDVDIILQWVEELRA